jgi:hypothetical protein
MATAGSFGMNRISLLLNVVLLFGVHVGQVNAGLVAPRSLLELEQKADLIVVGSTTEAIQAGATINITLQVSRVVKGDAGLSGTAIRVVLDSTQNMGNLEAVLPATGNGLWFLQNSSGNWSLIPVTAGAILFGETFIRLPAGSVPAPYAYAQTASLSDKVASEISAGIESGTANTGIYGNVLQSGLLDELNSTVTQRLYQRTAASSSPQLQELGLSGLIRGGNTAALVSALKSASRFADNGVLVASIRNEFRASDANAIAVLGEAATNATNLALLLRVAAAHALAAIHSVGTLPYLATLLDSPNYDLRVEAIGGFSAFSNSLPIQTSAGVPSLSYLQLPASAPYKTQDTLANFAMGPQAVGQRETSLLSFWKSWWSQHRTSLGY